MAAIRVEPRLHVLNPGETVRVPIVLALDEPLKIRGLHATFHGAEESKAIYTTYNAATKTSQTHTAVEHVDIVKTEYLLTGRERQGFIDNFADGVATLFGGGEHDVLDPGEYPFEVDIEVPVDARPTLAGKMCRVFYELSVLADVPLARDLKTSCSFLVEDQREVELWPGDAVRVRYPEDQHRGLLDSWLGPDIRCEAALSNNVFRPGKSIEGVFALETTQPLEVRAISVRLLSVESTQACGHAGGHTHTGEAVQIAEQGTIEGTYSQRFSLPVTLPGPATTKAEKFSIDCFVQIELDVPWAKDPRVRVPIILLER